jgi:hypothetical protein
MFLPTPRNIAASARDLRTFLTTRERHEWLFAGIAVAITAFIIFAFWHDSRFDRGEDIVFVQNWPANRTDAEIVADQKKDRIARDQAEAARRASFQKVQKATSGWL